jgi:hypothetical protein
VIEQVLLGWLVDWFCGCKEEKPHFDALLTLLEKTYNSNFKGEGN